MLLQGNTSLATDSLLPISHVGYMVCYVYVLPNGRAGVRNLNSRHLSTHIFKDELSLWILIQLGCLLDHPGVAVWPFVGHWESLDPLV